MVDNVDNGATAIYQVLASVSIDHSLICILTVVYCSFN